MIEEKCFSGEWIRSFRSQREHRSIQLNILEKMIYALHLLEQLVRHKLDFVFKGGTSLVLLLDEENRFSVDLDIMCTVDQRELEKILNDIVNDSKFSSVKLDLKRSYQPGIPKAHYVFEFGSVIDTGASGKLWLDVLIENHSYPEVVHIPISTKWIHTTSAEKVKVPSLDSITGDKLTAFAPNTIGIPYYKAEVSCSMEICKQLYDLSKLFPHIRDVEKVNRSYQKIAKGEIGFRKIGISPEAALRDTIDTCYIIAQRDTNREEPNKTHYTDLSNSIRGLGANFLMKGTFRIEEAITASAKVAYLAAKLLQNDLTPVDQFQGQDISEYYIGNTQWDYLNRLKRYPDKSAFYYWVQTLKLLNELGNT